MAIISESGGRTSGDDASMHSNIIMARMSEFLRKERYSAYCFGERLTRNTGRCTVVVVRNTPQHGRAARGDNVRPPCVKDDIQSYCGTILAARYSTVGR